MICVTANPSLDKLFLTDALRPGHIHRPRRLVQTPGGKGLNVARTAKALGASVRATGLLAGHTGRLVRELLSDVGVESDFVAVEGETRACLSVLDGQGSMTEFYEDGPAVEQSQWEELRRRAVDGGAAGEWLSLSGSLPRGIAADAYAELVVAAHAAGLKVAVDTNGAPLRAALHAQPDAVKVNLAEARECLGRRGEAALTILDELHARSGATGATVVSDGAHGAHLLAPDGLRLSAAPPVLGPYAVGSGDALLGGMLTALEDGDGWESALRLGMAAASANAESPGAGTVDTERVRLLFNRTVVESRGT